MPAPKGHAPYNKNGEGGRPLIFDDVTIEKLAEELDIWIKDESNYWIKDFCLNKGLRTQLMSEWASKSKRFSESLERAKQIQESRIFKGAMSGMFNPTMSKFGLSNCHGWSDKIETKISGDVDNPLSFILKSKNDTSDLVNNDEDQ